MCWAALYYEFFGKEDPRKLLRSPPTVGLVCVDYCIRMWNFGGFKNDNFLSYDLYNEWYMYFLLVFHIIETQLFEVVISLWVAVLNK